MIKLRGKNPKFNNSVIVTLRVKGTFFLKAREEEKKTSKTNFKSHNYILKEKDFKVKKKLN